MIDEELENVVRALVGEVQGLRHELLEQSKKLDHVLEIARLGHDDDRGGRERLRAARAQPGYEAAFGDAEPLVSIVMPAWNNVTALRELALPAILAQTYQRFEVVIVGDASPPEIGEAVAAFGDERLRFVNRTYRGPYPEVDRQRWLTSGTPGYNLALELAQGAWIAPASDDDPWTPDHLETLLGKARRERLEFVYGQMRVHLRDGRRPLLGVFPPEHAQIGLQAALFHGALRDEFQMELGDALFDVPNDWGVIRRMMRAGVRMGFVEQVVVEYLPSERSPAHDAAPEAFLPAPRRED